MSSLRKSMNFKLGLNDQKLRNSINFLNSELIRTSFARNTSLGSLNKIPRRNESKHQRISSLHKIAPEPSPRQQTDRQINYSSLKDTLKDLEEKIGKAKKVLKNVEKPRLLKGKNCSLIEE